MSDKIEQDTTATNKISAMQIEQWKKEHNKVFCYKTADGREAYFKTPDRRIISAAAVLSGNDHLKNKEIIISKCWLGGDEAIKNEDKYFYGLASTIDQTIESVEGELKEL